MSEKDTGATRISDVGRNLLVASTNLLGWTVDPVVAKQRYQQTNVRGHLGEKGPSSDKNRLVAFAPFQFEYPSD